MGRRRFRLWGGGLLLAAAAVLSIFWLGGYKLPGPLPADDEQMGFSGRHVIKFSYVVAENTPKGLAAQRFADLVEEKSGGKVQVQLFPNGTLFTEPDEQAALARGDVQMIAPAFSNLSTHMPEWSVMDLPFAFRTEEAVEEAFSGEVGSLLFKRLESRGMIGLAFWGNGFKQMTSSGKPLVHPEDFSGMKFRILPGPIVDAQFRALGASTSDIPFNSVYKAYESGGVDGGENTITNIYSKKFYQVQKYMTVSNHAYLGYAVLMNRSFWESLPADVQAIIQEAMRETTGWANESAREMSRKELAEMRSGRLMNIVDLQEPERREWMALWEPLYGQAEKLAGRELMDAVRRLRSRYGGEGGE
ncbi:MULTISPECIES: DctP family TRAP transporter solute-binding subunit [unclassified Paenibacillus]|uniref:DctP family TRAP transporter solute-binding subunit n=1 Tax=unclassified Paenibacillus TaxID=185978 RepID=UPI0009542C81|nr:MULTISPECIES: DctP family TRAP transporter solute-binding subunit [unclassified Paenibacillus]ASS67082.1 DctP family TRAP transporter solute-binding subunit [Paenibacillus sp. RUD330]SIQ90737.1 C4-dicarboxylate-binding protein DctP [Paenibacillus sp. RU4X]SIR11600.1 C4-dicarboxylate-binding protein DctP [Paenibacillus sp. RU4T]